MPKPIVLAAAFIASVAWTTASTAAEVTITGPVLSVYEDGFRVADDKAQAMRVFAWSLCGDSTRDHIRRGDQVTVVGDREWRMVEAASVTRPDGTPACPEDAKPRY
jgi:hypothetical protein